LSPWQHAWACIMSKTHDSWHGQGPGARDSVSGVTRLLIAAPVSELEPAYGLHSGNISLLDAQSCGLSPTSCRARYVIRASANIGRLTKRVLKAFLQSKLSKSFLHLSTGVWRFLHHQHVTVIHRGPSEPRHGMTEKNRPFPIQCLVGREMPRKMHAIGQHLIDCCGIVPRIALFLFCKSSPSVPSFITMLTSSRDDQTEPRREISSASSRQLVRTSKLECICICL
jgi:hypothetical protein